MMATVNEGEQAADLEQPQMQQQQQPATPRAGNGNGNGARAQKQVGLSVVSKQYDRGNKGYLDKTEKKLRELDSQNLGHLDIDKVYQLMQEFQSEQRKALTLKYVVLALSGFAVLLCLANIGTSFAAATLAKDLTPSPNGDGSALVVKGTGKTAATKGLIEVTDLDDYDGTSTQIRSNSTVGRMLQRRYEERSRRRLQQGVALLQTRQQLSQQAVESMMSTLCGNWPGLQRYRNQYNCNQRFVCGTTSRTYAIKHSSGRCQREFQYRNLPTCDGAAQSWRFKLSLDPIRSNQNFRNACGRLGDNAQVADWDDFADFAAAEIRSRIIAPNNDLTGNAKIFINNVELYGNGARGGSGTWYAKIYGQDTGQNGRREFQGVSAANELSLYRTNNRVIDGFVLCKIPQPYTEASFSLRLQEVCNDFNGGYDDLDDITIVCNVDNPSEFCTVDGFPDCPRTTMGA